MSDTKIEWTDKTWNPVTGCTKISEGCKHCYAESLSKRFAGRKGWGSKENPFAVTLHPERLVEPLKWKKPRMVFVCSMGDIFHEDVPDEFIRQVWDVMWEASHHTFIILTKRPKRMAEWVYKNARYLSFGWGDSERHSYKYGDLVPLDTLFYRNDCGWKSIDEEAGYHCDHPKIKGEKKEYKYGEDATCMATECPIATEEYKLKDLIAAGYSVNDFADADEDGEVSDSEVMRLLERPRKAFVSNVWLGVTAENQEQADKRIPILLDIPAAKRFVSIEPMLGRVDLTAIDDISDLVPKKERRVLSKVNALTGTAPSGYRYPALDWVICGGESGQNSRPMNPEWVRSVRDQCRNANVPFFFKQWGIWYGKKKGSLIDGKEYKEFPHESEGIK